MDTGKKLCSNRPCKYKLILIPGGLRYRPSFRTKRREGDLFYKTCSKASGERQIHPSRFTLASQGVLYPILIESPVGYIQGYIQGVSVIFNEHKKPLFRGVWGRSKSAPLRHARQMNQRSRLDSRLLPEFLFFYFDLPCYVTIRNRYHW